MSTHISKVPDGVDVIGFGNMWVRPAELQAVIDALREQNTALEEAASGQATDAATSRISQVADALQKVLDETLAFDGREPLRGQGK